MTTVLQLSLYGLLGDTDFRSLGRLRKSPGKRTHFVLEDDA